MWNPFRRSVLDPPPTPMPAAASVAPSPPPTVVAAKKRAILHERVRNALARLEAKRPGATGEKAEAIDRKMGELRRSLRVLELQAEIEQVRAGDVTVTPGPATLNTKGG